MARLGDLQLASLIDEIACAMRCGTPVIDAMRRLQSRRLGRVGRVAGRIAERLERGESVAEAASGIGSAASVQAVAGILACEQGGDPHSLERMAGLLRQRAQYARNLRIAWFYPWLLLAVGYLTAVFIMTPMILRFEGRDFSWPPELLNAARWLSEFGWLPPIVAVAVLLVFATWLHWRDRFPREARLSLFCHALADQLSSDIPDTVAISRAAGLAGDTALMQLREPTLGSPQVARIIALADPLPAEVSGGAEKQTRIAQLRYIAAVHAERFHRQAYFWSRLFPRVIMVVVGASVILFYAWWVIGPVYRQVAQW